MTMRWISPVRLAREQGISWMDAEAIIREETSRIRDRGPMRWWFNLIWLTSMLWTFAGARWLFPELGRLALFGVELGGLVVMMGAYCAPRVLARDAILQRARQHSTGRAIQNS